MKSSEGTEGAASLKLKMGAEIFPCAKIYAKEKTSATESVVGTEPKMKSE